jgi:hypothetical protein
MTMLRVLGIRFSNFEFVSDLVFLISHFPSVHDLRHLRQGNATLHCLEFKPTTAANAIVNA